MSVPLLRWHTHQTWLQDVSSEELGKLEEVPKKIGERPESLTDKKGHSQFGKACSAPIWCSPSGTQLQEVM